ncbi:MAG: orotate phosphoribosyltransferase, partial [Clostridiales Family XIII bacterium]|nr:orotate phosphoribosyltransferase [Clostridiales Family XIII bacterium]
MEKNDFIRFLIARGALKFGDFTTKSGRQSPYFINMG